MQALQRADRLDELSLVMVGKTSPLAKEIRKQYG